MLLVGTIAFCTSCKRHSPGDVPKPPPAKREISPRSIDLAGVKFYQTANETKARFPTARWEKKDNEIEVCSWRPTVEERDTLFNGIARLNFTFYRDTLQTIKVEYFQMLDVEYANFGKAVRQKYAYASADRISDNTATDWQYDSVGITLTPNRKQHWTGSLSTYTPVLEFQERYVYRRWLDAIQNRQVKTIY